MATRKKTAPKFDPEAEITAKIIAAIEAGRRHLTKRDAAHDLAEPLYPKAADRLTWIRASEDRIDPAPTPHTSRVYTARSIPQAVQGARRAQGVRRSVMVR